MKKGIMYAMAFGVSSILFSCTSEVSTYKTADELREQPVKVVDARSLVNPGKISMKDNFIYVNEWNKGVHIIDNTDPSNPTNKKFISIPGNQDIALNGSVIYADSYMDLLAIDTKTNKITRVKDAFKEYHKEKREEALLAMEDKQDPLGVEGTQFQAVSHGAPASAGNPAGTNGSMARFAVVDGHLYVLDNDKMTVYDVQDPNNPVKKNEIKMDFKVETIFPHEDKLFLGGTEGMKIYDNSNPSNPTLLSTFTHAIACDPVVVAGNFAYVTLRNGGPCNREVNRLEVVNIEDLKNPTLVSQTSMHNPHGLSVTDNDILFLCDGTQGLKVFNVQDKNGIKNNMLFKARDIQKAYDVIAAEGGNRVLVVGKNGLFQYDASNPNALTKLSEIKVDKAS